MSFPPFLNFVANAFSLNSSHSVLWIDLWCLLLLILIGSILSSTWWKTFRQVNYSFLNRSNELMTYFLLFHHLSRHFWSLLAKFFCFIPIFSALFKMLFPGILCSTLQKKPQRPLPPKNPPKKFKKNPQTNKPKPRKHTNIDQKKKSPLYSMFLKWKYKFMCTTG